MVLMTSYWPTRPRDAPARRKYERICKAMREWLHATLSGVLLRSVVVHGADVNDYIGRVPVGMKPTSPAVLPIIVSITFRMAAVQPGPVESR